MPDWIARPGRKNMASYPWRPLDNRERRSIWAARYFLLYRPFGHGTGTVTERQERYQEGTESPPE